jgi:hypothetical protein
LAKCLQCGIPDVVVCLQLSRVRHAHVAKVGRCLQLATVEIRLLAEAVQL